MTVLIPLIPSFVLILIPMLMNVAFLTLLERKILSYIQIRKGPNKVSIIGLLQPFADVVKLFTKESMFLISSNYLIYLACPLFSILFTTIIWVSFPAEGGLLPMGYSWIFILLIMGLSIFPLLISGWASNSKYSFLGSIRGVAQMISFEVIFTLLVFLISLMSLDEININSFMEFNKYFKSILLFPFIYALWLFSCVMETSRSPFDFAEGESELVSGFNTEYSSGGFALIFMSEYLSILFFSMLTAALLSESNSITFFLAMWFNSFIWIWLRGTFPRHRYDLVMYFTWKSILPLTGNIVLLFIMINIISFLSPSKSPQKTMKTS